MATSVYPMVKDWKFEIEYNQIRGQRVYVDIAAHPGDSLETTLPSIGASWDSDYPTVTLKRITVEYIGERANCPKKYVCYYDGTLLASYEGATSPITIPVSAELSGNFDTYTNPVGTAGEWYWVTDSASLGSTSIPRMVFTETIILHRFLYGNDLADFHKSALFPCLNKVNKFPFLGTTGTATIGSTTWAPPTSGGFAAHTVLFTGCNLQEQISQSAQRKWQCDLHFQVRCVAKDDGTCDPTALNARGWNFIYRNDKAKYDVPKNVVGAPTATNYLYHEADFEVLFTTGTPVSGVSLPSLPSF